MYKYIVVRSAVNGFTIDCYTEGEVGCETFVASDSRGMLKIVGDIYGYRADQQGPQGPQGPFVKDYEPE